MEDDAREYITSAIGLPHLLPGEETETALNDGCSTIPTNFVKTVD